MKRPETDSRTLPQHDYGMALKNAVSWLGNRYLLAEPVFKRAGEHKPYFNEPRRWHDTLKAAHS